MPVPRLSSRRTSTELGEASRCSGPRLGRKRLGLLTQSLFQSPLVNRSGEPNL
jgi:hypothetical protein